MKIAYIFSVTAATTCFLHDRGAIDDEWARAIFVITLFVAFLSLEEKAEK